MQYSPDELLFKKLVEEMGLEWDETPGEITINGISAIDVLEKNDIFHNRFKGYLARPVDKMRNSDYEVSTQITLAA